ncbi:sigma-54 interaction domain-containing protein [Lysinibacillus sp. FW12]
MMLNAEKLVQSMLDAFGELLQLEMAYFTSNGEVFIATEEYRKQKGITVHLPFFQKYYSKSVQYLQKPGQMKVCSGCRFQNNCPSKVEMMMNLVKGDRHFGYLTFVSFTEEGEKKLSSEQKIYQNWLTRLGDMIINALNSEGSYLLLENKKGTDTKYVLGNAPHLQLIKSKLSSIANSPSSIVITGETGTGKSLLAKYIHSNSITHKGKFIELNCASIPENLFESELFGYDEGAFTGARRKGKMGYFEVADKGTLFLDEITELPLHLQAKLLTVLQDGLIYRVGAIEPRKVNVRIIAATNKSLEDMVRKGEFRSDLYYRLNVIPLTLPPLKERTDEIEYLIEKLLEKIQHKTGKFIKDFSNEFLEELKLYSWPGNIRELENVLEYSMVMENSLQLTKESLPKYIIEKNKAKNLYSNSTILKDTEMEVIYQMLARYGDDTAGKERVAEELGISTRTLYRKLKSVNL